MVGQPQLPKLLSMAMYAHVHLSHPSYPRPCGIPHWTTKSGPAQAAQACSHAHVEQTSNPQLEQLLLSASSSLNRRRHRRHRSDFCLHCTLPLPSCTIISTSCLCSAAQSTPLHEPPALFAHSPHPPHVGSLAVLPASAILVTMALSISMQGKKSFETALRPLGRRKNRQIVSP